MQGVGTRVLPCCSVVKAISAITKGSAVSTGVHLLLLWFVTWGVFPLEEGSRASSKGQKIIRFFPPSYFLGSELFPPQCWVSLFP